MKNNYQVISIDLDGTLLKNDKSISDYTINVLKRLHDLGKCIVISTGRSFVGIPERLKQANVVDYYILSNGATCYDKKRNCIFSVYIEPYLIEELIVPNNNVCMEFLINGEWFINAKDEGLFAKIIRDEDVLNYILRTRKRVPNIMSCINSSKFKVEKINFNFEDKHKNEGIEYVNDIVRMSNGKLRCWTDKSHKMDLYNSEATKGQSLRRLLDINGYSLNNTIGFGDDDNDYELLKSVGLSVAMENANSNIKSICKSSTISNEFDGVARFLENTFELKF